MKCVEEWASDPQGFIHPFDRVLELVGFQLPYNFHPNISYLKPIGLTWYQRGLPPNVSQELMFQT